MDGRAHPWAGRLYTDRTEVNLRRSPNFDNTIPTADIPSTVCAIGGCGQREMKDAAPAITSLSGVGANTSCLSVCGHLM